MLTSISATARHVRTLFARDSDLGSVYQVLLEKGTNAWEVGVAGSGSGGDSDKWYFAKGNVAILAYSTGTVPADSSWHHYAITRSATRGAGSTIVYVDGSAATNEVAANYAVTCSDTADALLVGRASAADYAGGRAAYIAIYKSVLSAARIAPITRRPRARRRAIFRPLVGSGIRMTGTDGAP